MPDVIKWIKPSGIEFKSNDNKDAIAYLESIGYKRDEPKRRGRPPKDQDFEQKDE